MKKCLTAAIASFILTGTLLFTACNAFLAPSGAARAEEPGIGTVKIVFDTGSARNVLPSIKYDKYNFIFKNGGIEVRNETVLSSALFSFILEEGIYTLDVKTFRTVNGIDNLAAEGNSGEFTVSSASNNVVEVTLNGAVSNEYTGIFSLAINFPSDAVLDELRLGNIDLKSGLTDADITGSGNTKTLSKTIDGVPSGYPILTVNFIRNGKEAGISEVIEIYRNSITEFGTLIDPVVISNDYFVTPANIPVTGITLAPLTLNLNVGDGALLNAIFEPLNASNKNVTWTSSNPNVASIENGTVTALNAGSTTIKVKTVNGKTASARVYVEGTGNGGGTGHADNEGVSDGATVTQFESGGKIFNIAGTSTGIYHASYQGRSNVLEISPAGWAALTYNLNAYSNQSITITVQASVRAASAGVKVGFKINQDGYPTVASSTTTANNWVTVSGSNTVTISEDSRVLYLDNDSSNGLNSTNVYVADLQVTVSGSGGGTSTTLWKSDIADKVLGTAATYTNDNGTMTVNYNDGRQIIDGFGGSNAWKNDVDKEHYNEVIEKLYSKTNGIGLTILRNRIPFRERYPEDNGPNEPNDNFIQVNGEGKGNRTYRYDLDWNGTKTFDLNWAGSYDLAATKATIDLIKNLPNGPGSDFTIMSTPWTPPNNNDTQWKSGYSSNSTPDRKGSLKPAFYNDYADLLADYVKNFESEMGWPLSVLSIQNESNWAADYESCVWTGDQIKNFLITLGQRFYLKDVQKNLGVMAAENMNFTEDLITQTLGDTQAKSVLNYVGVHQYEADSTPTNLGAEKLTQTSAAGKRIWQTEMGQTNKGGQIPVGTGINNALVYARMIHYDFTVAEANAWLYWWLWSYNNTESDHIISFNNSGVTLTKRYYAVGHFSKFIRPGYQRIGSTASTAANVFTTAYKNPNGKEIVLVLINSGNSAANINVTLQNSRFVALNAYRTSASEDLSPVNPPAAGSASISGYSLPGSSITTLVGTVE
ncbi:Ig-like domain-containing protein [Leadbettera azotonutricia]|uniref:Putative lipoprotein n=1 Tax=Leadbettera azotonutricia (strain ATCC BAA-888 / DSM 13862 / ZAS-9) TaxID=545695 RepID=F5YDP9_LEAAZ|nr:glycoside hydrolase [Leadbettera azotonutricia]AEF81937.1 putative lipoprotein [Leadbettera azotonutricia ZAS-9]